MFKQPFKNNHSSLQVLQQTQQNLARQRQLLQAIRTSLPDNLASHCLYAVANKNSVSIFTDSSVWASKLLYMRRTIIDAVIEQACDRPITLKVKVMTQQARARQHRPKSPSHKTLQMLSDANNLKLKDSLNESLINLFNTLKKNKLTD